MQNRSRVFRFISMAMLSAIAYLLMMLNFPLPGFPPYLKIDFSEIPVLVGGILFGPVAAIIIEAVKNFLDYAIQGSFTGVPIGQSANFLAGMLFVLPAVIMARRIHSKKGLIGGLVSGVVLMAVMMSVLNFIIILPMYMWFLHFPHMTSGAMLKLVTAFILPFNLIKGGAAAVIFLVLYPKLQPIFNRFAPKKQFDAA
ncbi:MAG TPA: ECF transporter S component [Bacillales bacterium]|nr:ECF transporter S component [Bacillales bacterium]